MTTCIFVCQGQTGGAGEPRGDVNSDLRAGEGNNGRQPPSPNNWGSCDLSPSPFVASTSSQRSPKLLPESPILSPTSTPLLADG